MLNKYKNITMYELNLIFLESKYQRISYSTYGSYQDKAKVINEYLGNIKVRDIDDLIIKDFYNYIKNDKKWSYLNKISFRTINNIMEYLYMLLKMAKSLKIISIDSPEISFNKEMKEELFIKERYKFFLDVENKRISSKMYEILNVEKAKK